MARLKDEVKFFIVQQLAAFTSPSAVQAAVKETFGLELEPAQVVYYNPATTHTDLAPKWRKAFAEARAAFTKDSSAIATSHKTFRLRELDRMYRLVMEAAVKAMTKDRPNLVLVNQLLERGQSILEQAAKEMGEAFTNRRQLVSPNPLEDLARMLELEPSQLAAALATEGIDT